MGSVLVFVQHVEGKIPKASLVTISAAKKIKEKWGKSGMVALCLGKGASSAAEQALCYGFDQVLYAEDAALEKYLASTYAQAALAAYKEHGCDTFILPASSSGKDFSGRVSAALQAGQASDVVGLNDDGTLKRPMYAGNVFADVSIETEHKVVTVRGTAFPAAEKGSASGSKSELKLNLDLAKAGEVVAYEFSKSERPELGDASVVVSGGRALQSAENFEKVVFPLADALGAAVGASRAAVDSGYAPNDWQVGQTGKVVAPNLYIALGISGAIQHLAGMKDSKVIVAINKDPDAPIYEVADYGLVADLFEVAPKLTAAIAAKKGS